MEHAIAPARIVAAVPAVCIRFLSVSRVGSRALLALSLSHSQQSFCAGALRDWEAACCCSRDTLSPEGGIEYGQGMSAEYALVLDAVDALGLG